MSSNPGIWEFDAFRLDTGRRTLQRIETGEAVRLTARPLDALCLLVERHGEIVSKQELMQRLWPHVVVEESNLTQTIYTLRQTLGEGSPRSRFIVTEPGRGYRFVCPARWVPQTSVAVEALVPFAAPERATGVAPVPDAVQATPVPRRPGWPIAVPRWLRWSLVAAILGALVGGLVRRTYEDYHGTAPVTAAAEYVPLTSVADLAVQPALSPDGRFLVFIRGGGSPYFPSHGQIWLKALPDGELIQLTHETKSIFAPGFTPDGTHVTYSTADPDRPGLPWDTRIVPITGGESALLLSNASGLSFIGSHEVLYSEFKGGLHLGLVTSGDDRSHQRNVYLPSHERGMAHFSSMSPDRTSVLVVEMGADGSWQQCRLVPFDGSTPGREVGPEGACRAAAWSPDGRWMYFAMTVAGESHLWRQRFPEGEPQQITFGPDQESGLVVASDGRSLLTSLGQEQRTIWVHDGDQDRQVATEGFAIRPKLSADERRVYYLAGRSAFGGLGLSRLDLATGRRESWLQGLAIASYDVSRDDKWVVFALAAQGASEIWIAPLDRRTSPVRIARGGDEPAFDDMNRIYFRSVGAQANHVHRMNADGSADVQVLAVPITEFQGVSPDGDRLLVTVSMESEPAGSVVGTYVAPVAGGSPQLLLRAYSPGRWSRDGRRLYLDDQWLSQGRTRVVQLRPDELPAAVMGSQPVDAPVIPHAEELLSVGSDPGHYVYLKSESWQNIYRIPLH
jgi:DNA-binding winged helix-turn-helix (wHTH) protein/Tol biopolymer transport system component